MGFSLLPKKCIKKAELKDFLGPSSSRDGPPLWLLLPVMSSMHFLVSLVERIQLAATTQNKLTGSQEDRPSDLGLVSRTHTEASPDGRAKRPHSEQRGRWGGPGSPPPSTVYPRRTGAQPCPLTATCFAPGVPALGSEDTEIQKAPSTPSLWTF